MATVGGTNSTLLDWAKRTGADGKQEHIIQLLANEKAVLNDMDFTEGNLPTGARVTVQTGLPEVYWRRYNQPIPASSDKTKQLDISCKQIISWGQDDADLMELGGDVATARYNKTLSRIESVGQEFEKNVFYGNSDTDEDKFNGFAISHSSLSGENSKNVIDGGGTGSNNSSIYLVGWGPNKVYGIFPKGSKAGIQHIDEGKVTSESGGLMSVYREYVKFDSALVIADWRFVVRICNIDVQNLNGGSAADLTSLMIKAKAKLPNLTNASFYVNSTLEMHLELQARSEVKSGGGLTYANVAGQEIKRFQGIPIKRTDALKDIEETVT